MQTALNHRCLFHVPGPALAQQPRAACPAAAAPANPCFLGRALVQGPVSLRRLQHVAATESSYSGLGLGGPAVSNPAVEEPDARLKLDAVALDSEVRAWLAVTL